MEWLTTTYQPTTLFSLKPSWATSTGGKSLLLPSPYAFKMALLDAAIRTSGLAVGEAAWPWLRDLHMAVRLPEQVTVTNLFGRILREKEIKTKATEKESAIAQAKQQKQWPFQSTIGFREYVYYHNPVHIALGYDPHRTQVELLSFWLLQISYLGKRGGLWQLLEAPRPLPPTDHHRYTSLTKEQTAFNAQGMIQAVDDCDPKMKFAEANIYDSARPKRITRHIVIPYSIQRSSKSYTLYQRLD